jgi:hypothetical protein
MSRYRVKGPDRCGVMTLDTHKLLAWIAAWCLETFRQRSSAIVAMIFSKLNRSIRSRIAGT